MKKENRSICRLYLFTLIFKRHNSIKFYTSHTIFHCFKIINPYNSTELKCCTITMYDFDWNIEYRINLLKRNTRVLGLTLTSIKFSRHSRFRGRQRKQYNRLEKTTFTRKKKHSKKYEAKNIANFAICSCNKRNRKCTFSIKQHYAVSCETIIYRRWSQPHSEVPGEAGEARE